MDSQLGPECLETSVRSNCRSKRTHQTVWLHLGLPAHLKECPPKFIILNGTIIMIFLFSVRNINDSFE